MHCGKQFVLTCFLELPVTCFEQTVENQHPLFLLLLFSSVGRNVCFTVLQRVDKTGKKNQREGARLRTPRGGGGGEAKAMLHVSVMHRMFTLKVFIIRDRDRWKCTCVLSCSIHLRLNRSIVPSKTSFTSVWLEELISTYSTVEIDDSGAKC